jgi:hypothetical protein
MSYATGPQWEYYDGPVHQPSSQAPQHASGHPNHQTPVSPLNSSDPLDTALNKLSLSDSKTTYQNTPVANQQPAQYPYSTHGFPPATNSQQFSNPPPAQVPPPAQQPSYSSAPAQHQHFNQQASSAPLAQQVHPAPQAPTPAHNQYPPTSGAPTYAAASAYPSPPNSYSQQSTYQNGQNPPLRQPIGTGAPTYAAAAHNHPTQGTAQPYQASQPQYSTPIQHNPQGAPNSYPEDVKHHYQAGPVSNQAPAPAGQKGPQPLYAPGNQYNNYAPTGPPAYQQSVYGQPPSQPTQNAPYTPLYTPQGHTPYPQPAGYFPNNQKQAHPNFTPPPQASHNGLPTPPYQGHVQGHSQGNPIGHQQGYPQNHPQAHTNGHPQGYAHGNHSQNVAHAQHAPGRAPGHPGGQAPMGHVPGQVMGHPIQRPAQAPQQHAGAPHAAAPNGAKPEVKAGGLSSYTTKATSSAKKFWSGTSTGKKLAMGAGVLVAGVLGFEAADAIGNFGDFGGGGGGDYSSGGGDYSSSGGDYSSGGADYSSGGDDYTSGAADYSGGGAYDSSAANYAYDAQVSDSLAQEQMMTSMNDSMNQQIVAGGQSVAEAAGVTYYNTDLT